MVQSFGGPWTEEKLAVLEKYLDSYTTALKSQPFKSQPFNLVYVDAFAGEGVWQPKSDYMDDYGEYRGVIEGSARRALKIQDKPFDRLVFIDKDPKRCASLDKLKAEHPSRDITVLNEDANDALPSICNRLVWNDRLVVFLDPYATSVQWTTIE